MATSIPIDIPPSIPADLPQGTPAVDWLRSAHYGFCAITKEGDEGDCSNGSSGSFELGKYSAP